MIFHIFFVTHNFDELMKKKIENESFYLIVTKINAPNIPLSITSMALYAFSMGMTYVSAFTRAEKSATKYGFPEDTKTYQLISGLWIAFGLLGNFLGPVIGGIAVEMLGFRYTTLIFWIPYLGMRLQL